MKTLLCADLHLANRDRFGAIVEEEGLRYDERTAHKIQRFYNICKIESPDRIIIAGDLFDSNRVAEWLRSYFFNSLIKLKIETFIIVGNHEVANGMMPGFSESNIVNNIHIIKSREVRTVDDFTLIGWTKDKDELIELAEKNPNKYLVYHGDEIKPNGFEWCVAGHNHYHTFIGKYVSIGSLFKASFAEENEKNGYIIIENNEWKFKENQDINIITFDELNFPNDGVFDFIRYKLDLTADEYSKIDKKAIKDKYVKTQVEFDFNIIVNELQEQKADDNINDVLTEFFESENINDNAISFMSAIIEKTEKED